MKTPAMKKMLPVLLVLPSLWLFQSATAQYGRYAGSSNDLSWLPSGYQRDLYYYLPDIDAYYYVPGHAFVFFNGRDWKAGPALPARFAGFDLYRCYKVRINENAPYLDNDYYKTKYAQYRGPQYQRFHHASEQTTQANDPYNEWYQHYKQNSGGQAPAPSSGHSYEQVTRPTETAADENPGYQETGTRTGNNSYEKPAAPVQHSYNTYTYPQRNTNSQAESPKETTHGNSPVVSPMTDAPRQEPAPEIARPLPAPVAAENTMPVHTPASSNINSANQAATPSPNNTIAKAPKAVMDKKTTPSPAATPVRQPLKPQELSADSSQSSLISGMQRTANGSWGRKKEDNQ